MRPLGAVFVQGVTKVADLLVNTGDAWDNDKLDDMFSSDDASNIKQIAVGGPDMSCMELHKKMGFSRCA